MDRPHCVPADGQDQRAISRAIATHDGSLSPKGIGNQMQTTKGSPVAKFGAPAIPPRGFRRATPLSGRGYAPDPVKEKELVGLFLFLPTFLPTDSVTVAEKSVADIPSAQHSAD